MGADLQEYPQTDNNHLASREEDSRRFENISI
jgi:hypothetical protein